MLIRPMYSPSAPRLPPRSCAREVRRLMKPGTGEQSPRVMSAPTAAPVVGVGVSSEHSDIYCVRDGMQHGQGHLSITNQTSGEGCARGDRSACHKETPRLAHPCGLALVSATRPSTPECQCPCWSMRRLEVSCLAAS